MEQEGRVERRLSRATLFRRAGVVGVAAAVPTGALVAEAAQPPQRERLESLTATEADALDAMLDRLIPTDASGPGAGEARVLRYVDRALDGELRADRPRYITTHAYGGTRMGDDADENVVDRFGFSHEVPNLAVLGASTFPTSGGRNPTETVMALAWRTADHLVASWEAVTG